MILEILQVMFQSSIEDSVDSYKLLFKLAQECLKNGFSPRLRIQWIRTIEDILKHAEEMVQTGFSPRLRIQWIRTGYNHRTRIGMDTRRLFQSSIEDSVDSYPLMSRPGPSR